MAAQIFETTKKHFGWHWECTCGLSGGCYFPKEIDAVIDGRGHRCPDNNRRAAYINDY